MADSKPTAPPAKTPPAAPKGPRQSSGPDPKYKGQNYRPTRSPGYKGYGT